MRESMRVHAEAPLVRRCACARSTRRTLYASHCRVAHERSSSCVVSASNPGHLHVAVSVHDDSPEITTGDGSAFERELGRHAPYVATIAYRLLGSTNELEDLVQEVLLTAFERRHEIRDPNAVRGWLATVTVRKAVRQLRRKRVRGWLGFDAEPSVLELPDRGPSAEQCETLTRVYRVMNELPVAQRVAWCLRYLDGMKLEEIATVTECSLATVKRRVTAAHTAIRGSLSDVE